MDVIVSAVIALLVLTGATLALLRRRTRGRDLVATQLAAVTPDTRPAPAPSGPAVAQPTGIDAVILRRIEELVVADRRVAAIELIRQVTGCGLGEAKIVVDRLTGARDRNPHLPAP